MEHVHIKHLSGSKIGLIEHFMFDNPEGLSIGRSAQASIRYDKDNQVSRLHAKIACGIDSTHEYRITDLGSTNGTFVNNKRLTSSVNLVPGDRVRLGRNGPEFQFDIDSRPEPPSELSSMPTEPRPLRGTVIAGAKEFVGEFVLGEKKNFIALFFKILPSPVTETMRIVDQQEKVDPFRFMAFAFTVLLLTEVSESLLEEKANLAEKLIGELSQTLTFAIPYLFFSTVQYKILRDVSHADRTFHSYLVMSAIVGGMGWLLLGLVRITVQISQPWGIILFMLWAVYSAVYYLRTSKCFWKVTYAQIFLYTFLSTIAGLAAILGLASILNVTVEAVIGINQ